MSKKSHPDEVTSITPLTLEARKNTLLALITDSYKRMATNRDITYRGDQKAKCNFWLEELSKIYESGEIVTKF